LGAFAKSPLDVADYRERARRRLPRLVFDYLEGGADDELTLRANREVLDRIRLVPRLLNDVAQRDQSVTLFGATLPTPLIIAPTGLNALFWRDGDLALARAAARAKIPFALSTASNVTIEQVSEKAGGRLWFQLYVVSRPIADALVDRALACGYSALILTVDVPLSGNRKRDLRNGFSLPFRPTAAAVLDMLRHPRWLADMARSGRPELQNLSSTAAEDPASQAALLSRQLDASFGWDDLKRLRDRWPRTLLVKGILHVDDAVRAIEMGADSVIVSNHGGRQLDGVPTPLEVLPRLAAAVDAPLLVDSGFRRGSDIVKALALGAKAVLIGRAALYGLAAAGESGVDDVLAILKREIDRALALVGCPSAAQLDSDRIDAGSLPGSRLTFG